MRVRVRLFAGLRERAGTAELELELAEGASVGDAVSSLDWVTHGVPVVMAVNHEYADAGVLLRGQDELALIPPVSGGSPYEPHVRITSEELSDRALSERVADPRAGAIVAFLGVTREVPALEYEAYRPMAERELREICLAAMERHGLCAAAVEHRIGTVPLAQASVAIAVSAPHRAEAFAGAREIIDTIKLRVPIWKKEEGEWVRGAVPAPGAGPASEPATAGQRVASGPER